MARSTAATALILAALTTVGPGLGAQEPIAAVRVDANEDGIPDRLGDTVLVAGVVTSGPFPIPIPEPHLRSYIQSGGAGIRLQLPRSFSPEGWSVGDSVEVRGVVAHQQGTTALVALAGRGLGVGTPVGPTDVEVTDLLGEAYEGLLVRVRGRLVDAQNTEIEGEGARIRVRARNRLLEDASFAERYHFALGPAEVVGIAEQYDPTAPYDAGYRIDLRDTAGLVILPDRRPVWLGLLAVLLIAFLAWRGSVSAARARRVAQLLETVRENQAALREREHLLQIVTEATSDVIWDLDVEERTIRWGVGFEELFGLPPDARSMSFERRGETIHPEDSERVLTGLRSALDGNTTEWDDEYRVLRSDGSVRHVNDRARIIRDEHGGALRMVGAVLDTTREWNAQRERRALEASLSQSQRLESVGVLAGGVAHDFNNLLLAILGNVELLQIRTADRPEESGLLREVRHAAERASNLTLQLLTYAGQAPSSKTELDLDELLSDMSTLLSAPLRRPVRLEMRLDGDVPLIRGDPAQLRQVLLNLVTNAGEALGRTESVVTVRTEFRRPTGAEIDGALGDGRPDDVEYVILSVEDEGDGVPPELTQRIIEPFFSTKEHGRGLGLSAALGIVMGHDGHLTLTTAAGEGSTFSVLLPPAVQEEREPARDHATTSSSGRVALIADDEDPVRDLLTRFAELIGLEVVAVPDGIEAMRTFDANPDRFAIAFLDLGMPGAKGDQVFDHLRATRPDLPVVMLSGHAAATISERMTGHGDVAVLQKPFTIPAFQTAVEELLGPLR